MNFPYVLSDEILLRSKYEKKMEKNYVLSDCPSLYILKIKMKHTHAYIYTYIYYIIKSTGSGQYIM